MSNTQPSKPLVKIFWYSIAQGWPWHWAKKALVLILFSLVVNHLAASDNFLEGDSYRFPLIGFLFTIVLSLITIVIAEANFKWYQRKYFAKKVETVTIVWFMATTLGYIAILYIPANILLELAIGGQPQFYFILIGLVITLLVCFVFIGLFYAPALQKLYRLSGKGAEITIEKGAKITKLNYENIACFYSQNRIVYTVKSDGATVPTGFTLNELEGKINDALFFRVNRQMIIHRASVDHIEKIENGKLRLRLKTFLKDANVSDINISRYKRIAFMNWYKSSSP